MKLLDKVKAERNVNKLKEYPDEELEVTLAWITGTVTPLQISRVLDITPGNVMVWLSYRVAKLVEKGWITVAPFKPSEKNGK